MIERIRKQRARLVASLPSADRELQVKSVIHIEEGVKEMSQVVVSSKTYKSCLIIMKIKNLNVTLN